MKNLVCKSLYEKQRVNFISLDDELEDDVYAYNFNIVRDGTYIFLNQARLSKGLESPVIVEKLYAELPEDKLANICK